MTATKIWCHPYRKQSSKVLSALESTLESSSVINLLWNFLDNLYEVSIVVVTATTLLLKWCAQVHNWASRKYFWGAELISQAGYSHDYGKKYHFYYLNGCLAWHCHEVLQVLVVCPDLHWVLGFFQEMPPLFQCTDDSKHLLVMNLIILLHQRQGFAIKGYQVLFLFSGQLLREDSSRGEVRTVSLNAEEFQVLGWYQD